jgi:hypothetical protein
MTDNNSNDEICITRKAYLNILYVIQDHTKLINALYKKINELEQEMKNAATLSNS